MEPALWHSVWHWVFRAYRNPNEHLSRSYWLNLLQDRFPNHCATEGAFSYNSQICSRSNEHEKSLSYQIFLAKKKAIDHFIKHRIRIWLGEKPENGVSVFGLRRIYKNNIIHAKCYIWIKESIKWIFKYISYNHI